jgi:hypothetical protein
MKDGFIDNLQDIRADEIAEKLSKKKEEQLAKDHASIVVKIVIAKIYEGKLEANPLENLQVFVKQEFVKNTKEPEHCGVSKTLEIMNPDQNKELVKPDHTKKKCCEIFMVNKIIQFMVNKIIHDNPILNHPKILKEISIKCGMSESELINIFSSFDKLFVEEACIAGNIEI